MSSLTDLKQMNPVERADFLNTHADTVQEEDYFRAATEQELSLAKDELSEIAVKQQKKKEELKDFSDKIKAEVKILDSDYKENLKTIRYKGTKVKAGKTYSFKDYETSMVDTYDPEGNLINSRRMRPDEKAETNLHSMIRTASNG